MTNAPRRHIAPDAPPAERDEEMTTEEQNLVVDEQSEDSFPASDSPSFTPITRTAPPHRPRSAASQTEA